MDITLHRQKEVWMEVPQLCRAKRGPTCAVFHELRTKYGETSILREARETSRPTLASHLHSHAENKFTDDFIFRITFTRNMSVTVLDTGRKLVLFRNNGLPVKI